MPTGVYKRNKKMNKNRKGYIPWNKGKKTGITYWLGKKRENISGENHPKYKGGKERFPKCSKCSQKLTHFKSKTGLCGKCFQSTKKLSLETKMKIRNKELGNKHYNWKGGITSLVESIRKCFKYRQWRSDIFTRDNFICQICGIRGGEIIADHIKAFSFILAENNIKTLEEALNCEELWNINNGRTLCQKCHEKTDNFGGKNNKKDLRWKGEKPQVKYVIN